MKTEAGKETDRSYQRRRYHYRKSQGLCVKCGKPAVNSMCVEHREKARERYTPEFNRKRRQAWEQEGKCNCCGGIKHPELDPHTKRCIRCRTR